jgi:hypothetical protein
VYNVDAVYQMTQTAFFSEESYQPTPHNKLTAGFRYFTYDLGLNAIQSGLLGCGRRALAASGTLRCARREIGRPIPRAVSEISPNIAGG